MSLTCPYCGNAAPLIRSAEVYGGRDFGLVYACLPCDAYVGVHKGTTRAKGTLANKPLRAVRMQAHDIFDRIWQNYIGPAGKSRKSAYSWLQLQMALPSRDCHIAKFDIAQCAQVIALALDYVAKHEKRGAA